MSIVSYCIFAGGCFWGMDYYFRRAEGVVSVESGYIGGKEENPAYKDVKAHLTGHAEAVRVGYDPSVTSYEKLARLFFEIHDPEQTDGQGIDIGPQYRSEIFYLDEEQKSVAEKLVDILEKKGFRISTRLTPASKFWPAEEYHQDYFAKNGGEPDCHFYTKRF